MGFRNRKSVDATTLPGSFLLYKIGEKDWIRILNTRTTFNVPSFLSWFEHYTTTSLLTPQKLDKLMFRYGPFVISAGDRKDENTKNNWSGSSPFGSQSWPFIHYIHGPFVPGLISSAVPDFSIPWLKKKNPCEMWSDPVSTTLCGRELQRCISLCEKFICTRVLNDWPHYTCNCTTEMLPPLTWNADWPAV